MVLLLSSRCWAGSISTKWMPCSLIQGVRTRPFMIYLPDRYENSNLKYPVLYLLHGGGCDYTQWEDQGHLKRVADSLISHKIIVPMIIVCPQANDNVMTWFDDSRRTYESYFFKELIPYIESHYRVLADREHRSVAGFSMGGGASVVYGIHHPEYFSTVYAISAYLRRQPLDFLKNDPLGEWRQSVVERNNPIKTVKKAKDNELLKWSTVRWFVDDGTEDFTYKANTEFVKVMEQRDIPVSAKLNQHGSHSWDYWRPALIRTLENAFSDNKKLSQNQPLDINNQNVPLIQTRYTADPAPVVFNDTVFLYTTHDEDSAVNFEMHDWLLYTSTDMVNWTDHGPVASLKDFTWRSRDNGAWAIQTVCRNGKYYMYCPLHGHGIGVLVSDSPYGPFHDPLGKPLAWDPSNWYYIDPTVWVDDDGQAYMYWGNPYTYYARLNNDMISLKDTIVRLPYHIENYQEGPWFYKRNNHYYLGFASICCPEAIGYAMSDKPTGPWKSEGYIMRPTDRSRGNHPGIIEYKGHNYVFGLNYDIMHIQTPVHHERRSVSASEIHYDKDGKIQEIPYWLDQKPLKPLEKFNPYRRVEAETMNWGYGLKTEKVAQNNMIVKDIDDGEFIRLRNVDFGKSGAKKFAASVKSPVDSGRIIIRLDSENGIVIGILKITATQEQFKVLTTKIKKYNGVHDLYLCFENPSENLEFDYWEFIK